MKTYSSKTTNTLTKSQFPSQLRLFKTILYGLLTIIFITPSITHAINTTPISSSLITQDSDTEENNNSASISLEDPFGRDTPKGTVQGFIRALANHDQQLAGNYLQLNQDQYPPTQVRQFKKALDAGGRLYSDLQLSDEVEGELDDRLQLHHDQVGAITHQDQEIPLILVQTREADGRKIWLFSQDTLKRVPAIIADAKPTLVEKYSFDSLRQTKIFNVYISNIMVVLVLTLFAFAVVYSIAWFIYITLSFFYPTISNKQLPITDNVILPLSVMITSLLVPELMVWAGVSVTVREPFGRVIGIFAWASLTWLTVRIIDSTLVRAEQHSYKHNRIEQIAIIVLTRRLVKLTLMIISVIIIFGSLGFDLTTGIATLGLGGLALALGAQKTVENLVGGVVVVADKPVRVGDFCHFGNYEGIVMEIGIRSTRVRTFSRSVVTIPNGEFASMQIENFTAKDMFQFLHLIYIKRDCRVEELNRLIEGIDVFLNEHQLTNKEWNQVRISELRQDCYVVECQAYIDAYSRPNFFDKQTLLIIDLLKELENYDIEHAFPTQQILLDELPDELKNTYH